MRHVLLGSVPVLCVAGLAGDVPQRLVFEGDHAEHRWALEELDPAFPADWSAYEYLVMELRASSPQRFSVWLSAADGVRSVRLQPFGALPHENCHPTQAGAVSRGEARGLRRSRTCPDPPRWTGRQRIPLRKGAA